MNRNYFPPRPICSVAIGVSRGDSWFPLRIKGTIDVHPTGRRNDGPRRILKTRRIALKSAPFLTYALRGTDRCIREFQSLLNEDVAAGSAVEHVIARAADQDVIPFTSKENIIVFAPDQYIISLVTRHAQSYSTA